jgi:hypothetical protein
MKTEHPAPNSKDSRLRLAAKVCLVILVLWGAYSLHRGYFEIIDINDFEDNYHVAAKGAAERAADLYERKGPVKKQNFVYPPAAAVFFYPFSFFSFEIAGLIFTVLKTASLLGLMWGAIAWQRDPPKRFEHKIILITAAWLIALQPLLSDVFTGQVNMIVAFLAIAGVHVMMDKSRWGWFGSLLVAIAATIKGSPVLMFAVPFLHRKFKLLAIGLVAMLLLNYALPVAWFGHEKAAKFFEALPSIVNKRMVDNAIARHQLTNQDLEISLSDIIFFTSALLMAEPSKYEYDREDMSLYEVVKTSKGIKLRSGRLPEPFTPETAQRIYLLTAVVTGILFLAGRFWLLRLNCSIPWTWDAAVLLVCMILLLPVARRAQLVGLIFPVGYILLGFYRLWIRDGGLRALIRCRKWLTATTAFTLISFLLSDKPGIHLPGMVMPFRIWIPLSLFGMLAVLTQLLLIDRDVARQPHSGARDA